VAVGWRFLDVREMMDRDGRGGAVRRLEEMGERGKESDLKNCSRWPKTEYIRTYIGTFDRTHAGAWVHG
jgi:hypothetical protein